MDSCDVLVVGGGPAGSACAWALQRAGLDTIVIDTAVFPRDKVCAGWITPQVVDDLAIDVDAYRRQRTFQPITAFRTGLIGSNHDVDIAYDRPVSFGIRRCEFDHYLLERSGARLQLGVRPSSIRGTSEGWIVDERVRASMIVGAGGHFCPVARMLNERSKNDLEDVPLVVAQEVEFPIGGAEEASYDIAPERPELYFSRDLQGYGWCFRKERYLNVGFGSLERRSLPKASDGFVAFLKERGKIPRDASWRWRGHAYLLSEPQRRRIVDNGVVLIGDAAGLAYPQSGEGIRPAIESGLLAARAIVDARRSYTAERLASYERALRERFSVTTLSRLLSRAIPRRVSSAIAPLLFDMPLFVRHVLLDRWFLHSRDAFLPSRLSSPSSPSLPAQPALRHE